MTDRFDRLIEALSATDPKLCEALITIRGTLRALRTSKKKLGAEAAFETLLAQIEAGGAPRRWDGEAPEREPIECSACDGFGSVRALGRAFGCTRCHGTGLLPEPTPQPTGQPRARRRPGK